MDLKLNGKHIVITGASGGIGIELTRQFLSEGANVTACYNREKRHLTDLMGAFSENLLLTSADIRSEEAIEDLFKEANSRFGRVDGAIANAGIANHEGVSVSEMTLDQWEHTIRVNLTGTFLTAKYFFRNLEKYPGNDASLILVGSTAGVFGEAWYSDYSTSKAGMHGMMMSLKNEIVHIAPQGRVNVVNPGWTVTPMAEGAVSDPIMMSRIVQTIPLRKIAEPNDIASVIVFLSSGFASGHISGQTITVAGGMEGRVLFTPDEVSEYVNRYKSQKG